MTGNTTEEPVENTTGDSVGYKSFEERIWNSGVGDFCNEFGNFCKYGARAFYGTVASILRIPTLLRKGDNGQTFLQRTSEEEMRKGPVLGGIIVGGIGGLVFDFYYLSVAIGEALKKNYVPLAFLGATNILSGVFELGRRSQSRREHSELVERIEAEKKKKGQEKREQESAKEDEIMAE